MSTSEGDKYSYTPLASPNEFRLVRVHRSSADCPDDEPLSIEFLAARFDQNCTYAALSYAWGTDRVSIDIEVKGTRSQKLRITKSLADALRSLRKCHHSVLWIDALCIDQRNVEEKNIQVGRMAELYRRASCVVIWLGEASDDSDLAIEFMRNISTKDGDVLAEDRKVSKSWAALANLMRRSWFTRRWVVQEVAFARQAVLRCGTAMVSWTRFCEAVSLFTERLDEIDVPEEVPSDSSTFDMRDMVQALGFIPAALLSPPFAPSVGASRFGTVEVMAAELSFSPFGQVRGVGAHALIAIYDRVLPHERDDQEPHRLCTMETLLYYLPSFQVTDKRDVVFALASLAKDYSQFTPDYGQSVAQVYKNAVQQAVTTSGSLNIFCRPWAQSSAGLPSWIMTVFDLPFKPNRKGNTFDNMQIP